MALVVEEQGEQAAIVPPLNGESSKSCLWLPVLRTALVPGRRLRLIHTRARTSLHFAHPTRGYLAAICPNRRAASMHSSQGISKPVHATSIQKHLHSLNCPAFVSASRFAILCSLVRAAGMFLLCWCCYWGVTHDELCRIRV